MPSPRVKGSLTGTPAQVAAAKPLVQAIWPGNNRIARTNLNWTVEVLSDGRQMTTFEIELKTKAWGDAFWADIVATVPSVRANGVTGRVSYHQCPHGDPVVVPCTAPSTGYVEVIV